jgi:phenylalanyl-tRNA synthetase alpha chain
VTGRTSELVERLEAARRDALEKISSAGNLAGLEEVRHQVFGRKAPLAQTRQGLRDLDEAARKDFGRKVNEVQAELDRSFEVRKTEFEARELEQRWERERVDVTLPGDAQPIGSIHPLTRTMWEIVDIFVGLGYRVADGPEIELTSYLFDALNTPPEHPARSELDTYYVKDHEYEVALRTETSPVQIRTMESQEPPVYVLCPGRVYRRETEDATHTAQFSQIEGLAVDEGITMSDLKGTLQHFARELFGRDLEIRLRPSFFPFTEPSAELDVLCFSCKGSGCRICKNEGWIELVGCGMVDPFLLDYVGYDSERYTGFAFGLGLERAAALAHDVGDIRAFYDNDVRFLAQFGGMP